MTNPATTLLLNHTRVPLWLQGATSISLLVGLGHGLADDPLRPFVFTAIGGMAFTILFIISRRLDPSFELASTPEETADEGYYPTRQAAIIAGLRHMQYSSWFATIIVALASWQALELVTDLLT